ncbi:hypothetical protein ADUPG1_012618 [Aduncisulcus paluster]|uniref:NudC domain-containing protein 1 n=1 Tax=Aduncisulcus paluster TaxID=2918883 RepID=A0ABQ5K018_9EUKA|nr:hypothetical protein ADUPG1_012618 [Aduncisulcus paluster]
MSLSTTTIEAVYIESGDHRCSPIPRDDRSVVREYVSKKSFSHIYIPFSSTDISGVYVCVFLESRLNLVFSFTLSNMEIISKKYVLPSSTYSFRWFFLPVDLSDVISCAIDGKGHDIDHFSIESLFFIQKESPEETMIRESKEKLWSEAQIVLHPKCVLHGGMRFPIPRDDPSIINPSFSMVKAKDESKSKESKKYDNSLKLRKMMEGGICVFPASYISIPFPAPSPMNGAYIYVHKRWSAPTLRFAFTDSDGKKTRKIYEFPRPSSSYQWHFLPIDLPKVVLCEIEGKGTWDMKNSQNFHIFGLVFTMPEKIVRERHICSMIDQLTMIPWEQARKELSDEISKECAPFGFLALSTNQGRVYGIDLISGFLLWCVDLSSIIECTVGSMLCMSVHEETGDIYTGVSIHVGGETAVSKNAALCCISPTGHVKAIKYMRGDVSAMCVTGGWDETILFVLCSDGMLFTLSNVLVPLTTDRIETSVGGSMVALEVAFDTIRVVESGSSVVIIHQVQRGKFK